MVPRKISHRPPPFLLFSVRDSICGHLLLLLLFSRKPLSRVSAGFGGLVEATYGQEEGKRFFRALAIYSIPSHKKK